MAKLCALFSSSKANSIFLSTSFGNFLVDFGASFKATKEALQKVGSDICEIDAVFITHEHSDHIKGLKTFTSKLSVPIISSAKTLEALVKYNAVCENAVLVDSESFTELNGIKINRFCVSHDCVDPGGFRFDFPDGTSAAVCTDLGIVTDNVKEALKGCNALLIESNHDVRMLNNGPYPPELKMRIASDKGHISNNTCAALLKELFKQGTERFMLGHLSENNNTPLLARSAAEASLMDLSAKNGEDYILKVASPCGAETLYF